MCVQRDVLQLDRRIYQRLAKEDVCSGDQIEPRRVCFGMKEKALLLQHNISIGPSLSRVFACIQ